MAFCFPAETRIFAILFLHFIVFKAPSSQAFIIINVRELRFYLHLQNKQKTRPLPIN